MQTVSGRERKGQERESKGVVSSGCSQGRPTIHSKYSGKQLLCMASGPHTFFFFLLLFLNLSHSHLWTTMFCV